MSSCYEEDTKYKIGDIVYIRHDIQKDREYRMDSPFASPVSCTGMMAEYRGKCMTVKEIYIFGDEFAYSLEGDNGHEIPFFLGRRHV